jgi:hypothetical protein
MISCQIKMFVNIKTGDQTRKTAFIASYNTGLYVNIIKMLYLLAINFLNYNGDYFKG